MNYHLEDGVDTPVVRVHQALHTLITITLIYTTEFLRIGLKFIEDTFSYRNY